MNTSLSVTQLITLLKDRIPLKWIINPQAEARHINIQEAKTGHAGLLGTMNLIHGNQIQLIGTVEQEYLYSLSPPEYQQTLEWLFAHGALLIILVDDIHLPAPFDHLAEQRRVAIASTPSSSYQVASELSYILADYMAEKTTVHGVFMEVAGMGLLLSGDAAVGKSELALELISRGHRLIADDAPEFRQAPPSTIRGHCPPLLQDFLEVRGLGILNIRKMFGDNAIKPSKNLRLVVHLKPWDLFSSKEHDRLDDGYSTRNILGEDIPKVILPVAPGRNLAVLVETAARNHLLREHGYNSSEDLGNRLKQQLQENTP
ncbi:MAG: HPr(Ser) kinase/phosphatase [bacterium]